MACSRSAVALSEAAERLSAISDTPRLDAELLLAHALGVSREELLLGQYPDVPQGFAGLVGRRISGEPVAYILGRRGFWTIELEVGRGVLIPRPDSETLIEAAVAHFGNSAGPRRILDLGTGPGTLLLAALAQWPTATGVGIDTSPIALDFARRNSARLGLAERAELRLGNWAEGLSERFDLILCNPPYVALGSPLDPGVSEQEPPDALFGGSDGLDTYRAIAPQIPAILASGGIAAIEIGWGQKAAAPALLARDGLHARIAADLAGRPRCVLLTWV